MLHNNMQLLMREQVIAQNDLKKRGILSFLLLLWSGAISLTGWCAHAVVTGKTEGNS